MRRGEAEPRKTSGRKGLVYGTGKIDAVSAELCGQVRRMTKSSAAAFFCGDYFRVADNFPGKSCGLNWSMQHHLSCLSQNAS